MERKLAPPVATADMTASAVNESRHSADRPFDLASIRN